MGDGQRAAIRHYATDATLKVHDGITFQGADIICPELRLLCEGDVLGVEV